MIMNRSTVIQACLMSKLQYIMLITKKNQFKMLRIELKLSHESVDLVRLEETIY